MEGYYCPDKESAKAKVLELIGQEKKVVTYGGSMSLDEVGVKEAVEEAGHDLLRREKYVTPEEKRECFAKQTLADVFMMSTNAITLDGELVNIDGSGNRVACLAAFVKNILIFLLKYYPSCINYSKGRIQNKIYTKASITVKIFSRLIYIIGIFCNTVASVVFLPQRPVFMPDVSLRWELCWQYFCPRRMRCCRFLSRRR